MNTKTVTGVWIGIFLFYCFVYASIYSVNTVSFENDKIIYHSIPFKMTGLYHFGMFTIGFLVAIWLFQFYKPSGQLNIMIFVPAIVLWFFCIFFPLHLAITSRIFGVVGMLLYMGALCLFIIVFQEKHYSEFVDNALASGTLVMIPCSLSIVYAYPNWHNSFQPIAFLLFGLSIGIGLIYSVYLMSLRALFFAVLTMIFLLGFASLLDKDQLFNEISEVVTTTTIFEEEP